MRGNTVSDFTVRGLRGRQIDQRAVRIRWDGMNHVVEVVVLQNGGDPVVAREIGHFSSLRHATSYAARESDRTGYTFITEES